MIKRLPLLILLLRILIPCDLLAQNDKDFGIWYKFNTTLGVSKKIDASVSTEFRTFRNAGTLEEGLIEAGAGYELTKFLSAGASYRFSLVKENDSEYHPEHKLFIETRASAKPGDFTLQARFKYQIRFKTYFEEVIDKIPDHNLRVRLKTTYRTPSFPVNPWVFAETFIPTYPESEKFVGILRLGTGIEYVISKKHSIDLSYVFRRDYIPDIYDENILSIEYNLDF
ncbi:MAG TPA: DUF2490 domain-containing protein [Bacteroidales bacterium]|nr:DUF2490 domain-containing protein [Bacteroidales bacterium]